MALTINTPPKSTSERLIQLVGRVNNGEIKIPKFQRGFVWKRDDVLKLLESVFQGYPIGSLLFWRTEQKLKDEKDIEGFTLPSTLEKYPTNYVLDGQQRLTTIYGVLSYNGPIDQPHILNVVYDLRKKEIRHRQPSDNQWCLPLSLMPPEEFVRYNQFQQSLASLPDANNLNIEALRVTNTFREYEIPVVTLTEKTLEEVCPIFERINSTGTKLTVYDLMVAATFSEDFDLNDEVQELRRSLQERSFRISGDSILRTLSVVSGQSVKRKAILALRDIPSHKLRDYLKITRRALEKAIDFLRMEVNVISSDFLPYEAQLTILSKLFSISKDYLTPDQRSSLRSWFWLSSFHERYRGASDNIIDRDVERCDHFLKGGPFIPIRKVEHDDLKEKTFRRRTAITHAYVALLATSRPIGIVDAAKVDIEGSLSWENQREFHHIFPKGYLATGSDILRELQNDISNIMLLPSGANKQISLEKPSSYMTKLRDRHGADQFDEILATNLIPPLEDSGLLIDDFEYFLSVRLEMIVNKINELSINGLLSDGDTQNLQPFI